MFSFEEHMGDFIFQTHFEMWTFETHIGTFSFQTHFEILVLKNIWETSAFERTYFWHKKLEYRFYIVVWMGTYIELASSQTLDRAQIIANIVPGPFHPSHIAPGPFQIIANMSIQ